MNMATFLEIARNTRKGRTLWDRVRVACTVQAEAIIRDAAPPPNQAQRLLWAKSVLQYPEQTTNEMFALVVAGRDNLTIVELNDMSDNTVGNRVEFYVDFFADHPIVP